WIDSFDHDASPRLRPRSGVLGNSLVNSKATVLRSFEVLVSHGIDRFEHQGKWLVSYSIDVVVDPLLKRGHLAFHDLDGGCLLLRVAPVDVESGLDARREQQRNACSDADVFGLELSDLRHDADDVPCSVAEKVDRVLNPPGSHQRAAVDRNPQ